MLTRIIVTATTELKANKLMGLTKPTAHMARDTLTVAITRPVTMTTVINTMIKVMETREADVAMTPRRTPRRSAISP